jgi:predicted acyl esterase
MLMAKPKLGETMASKATSKTVSTTKAADGKTAPAMRIERDVHVTMRDGIRIALCIYRPDTDEPVPALFAASPYQYRYDSAPAYTIFAQRETGPIGWYVEQGFAFVHADVRGSGQSEGEFSWYGPDETADYYDLIEWVGTRDWCNGKVGGTGQSYYAVAQWWMGIVNPPHLACIVPYDGRVDHYRDAGYHGGIMGSFQGTWYNQVRFLNRIRPGGAPGRQMAFDLPFHVLEHSTYDDWWKIRNPFERLGEIKVPVLSIGHWPKLGLHLRGNIVGFEELKSPKKLLISEARTPPDVHHLCDDPAFHAREILPFYEHHLKGARNDVMKGAAAKIFVRGAEEFRTFTTWPPKPARFESWYLRKEPSDSVTSLNDGSLSRDKPSKDEGATSYTYPDAAWRNGVVAFDKGVADPVKKVLTFTSKPLEADLDIAGGIVLELVASSDQPDTDFIVKLSDQEPQSADARKAGRQPAFQNVSKGWLKASHHRTRDKARSRPDRPFYRHDDPQPITPGEIYTFSIEIVTVVHRFRKGHRIRLEIVNGDSPVTDGVWVHPYHQFKVGTDTIHHSAARPSRLILPIAPAEKA